EDRPATPDLFGPRAALLRPHREPQLAPPFPKSAGRRELSRKAVEKRANLWHKGASRIGPERCRCQKCAPPRGITLANHHAPVRKRDRAGSGGRHRTPQFAPGATRHSRSPATEKHPSGGRQPEGGAVY